MPLAIAESTKVTTPMGLTGFFVKAVECVALATCATMNLVVDEFMLALLIVIPNADIGIMGPPPPLG